MDYPEVETIEYVVTVPPAAGPDECHMLNTGFFCFFSSYVCLLVMEELKNELQFDRFSIESEPRAGAKGCMNMIENGKIALMIELGNTDSTCFNFFVQEHTLGMCLPF